MEQILEAEHRENKKGSPIRAALGYTRSGVFRGGNDVTPAARSTD